MPSARLDGSLVAETVHRLLRARGVTADVVHPSAALDAYRLVVVPTLYLVTDENAARVSAAADAGAQVLVTFFSGIADEDDHVRLGGYPGAFRDLLGVRVEELFPLASDETASLENGGTATLWSEDVTATAATVLDRYASGPLAGRPAVTRRDVGAGGAWYLSTLPDDVSFDALLGDLLDAAGVNPVIDGSAARCRRRASSLTRRVVAVPRQRHRRHPGGRGRRT